MTCVTLDRKCLSCVDESISHRVYDSVKHTCSCNKIGYFERD